MSSEEAERQRVARELHDHLTQRLALLNVEIDQLDRSLEEDELADRVRRLSKQVEDIASDVQRLSHELQPAQMQPPGLVASIASLCRDLANCHGIEIDFSHHAMTGGVSTDISLCVYRIVQEALHNVMKHSGAKRAAIQLVVDAGVLSVHIADHGRGFSAVGASPIAPGLVSMRERAAFVGGEMVVRSSPGAGTRIIVRVPLPAGANGGHSTRPGLID